MASQNPYLRKATFVAVCSLMSSKVLAQSPTTAPLNAPDAGQAPATDTSTKYAFTVGGNAGYAFDTDFRNDGGSLSVFRTGGSATMTHTFTPGNDLSVTFDGEYDHYFFRNFEAIPGDDGSDALDVYQFDLRPIFTHQFTPELSAFGGLTITASGESEAHVDDALAYGGFAGVTYRFSPTLSVGVGVGVTTQLEDNPYVFPLVTLDWQITPDLALTSQGTGVRLAYRLNETWTVFGQARYDYRQFRFAGDEIVSDGVLTDESVPITVGVTCRPIDRLSITGEIGAIAYRRLEIDSSSGHQINADEAEPAVFAGVQVEYSF